MLPEDWLRRIGMLAGMGTPENGHIRFRPSQAGLLDVLLAAQPEAKFDKGFALVRDVNCAGSAGRGTRWRSRRGSSDTCAIISAKAWAGWASSGGFLSAAAWLDDMGVGKTAQVLAMLEHRPRAWRPSLPNVAKSSKPSLVVVPPVVGLQLEAGSRALPHSPCSCACSITPA